MLSSFKPIELLLAGKKYHNRPAEITIRGTKAEKSLRKLEMCVYIYETLKWLEQFKTGSPYLFHYKKR